MSWISASSSPHQHNISQLVFYNIRFYSTLNITQIYPQFLHATAQFELSTSKFHWPWFGAPVPGSQQQDQDTRCPVLFINTPGLQLCVFPHPSPVQGSQHASSCSTAVVCCSGGQSHPSSYEHAALTLVRFCSF